MRIIAGELRGKKLASVGAGDTGAHLRPTTDRVRESLFNVLMGGAYGNPVYGMRVLDLFAGTGALGLEALSRGASHVTLVDDGRKALSLIRENIALCRAGDRSTVVKRDATRLETNPATPYDLVFLDPPYGMGLGEDALQAALRGGWIADNALVVFEDEVPQIAPVGFRRLDCRKYGSTHIAIMERDAS
jgi:16S rRNA (guanine966-N2)-methyltransferase